MSFGKLASKLTARLMAAFGLHARAKPAQKYSEADKELMAKLLTGLATQLRHEQEMVEARGQEPLSVRLVPQVPAGDRGSAAAWLGGGARLPNGTRWPTVDGSAFQLLAQIDCTRLPDKLWDGLGPRSGWLAIFLDPATFKVEILHFAEAGEFIPSPPVLENCTMVGYEVSKRARASGYTWSFACWPADIVTVVPGGDDPRRGGRSQIRHERFGRRYDMADERLWPFDWPTTQMMMNIAVAEFERLLPRGPVKHLTPEALAEKEQALSHAEQAGESEEKLCGMRVSLEETRAMIAIRDFMEAHGRQIVQRLRTLKEKVDELAQSREFANEEIAPILAELKTMNWMHKRVPPFYREGKKLSEQQRMREGVEMFTLPLTTHDPANSPTWVHKFEEQLLEAAKPVYLRSRALLPEALLAHCETVWGDEAVHEAAGMGHVPWGYVHEFHMDEDLTLIELPSSDLIGWMFGDVYNLVVTIKKADLARNDFSRPVVQVTN